MSKPAIVVLGAHGQLGRDLCGRLPAEDVLPCGRAELDLTQPEALTQQLTAWRPTLVFNCAAYNLVDRAESEPQAAFAVNAWGVRTLAQVCRDVEAVLVHFSTDYVYGLDGFRDQPYVESDAPGPLSVYGLSKLCGEYFVRALCPKHFVIRTSGLYGRHGAGGKGGNFVNTMLKLARQRKPLRVVEDQFLTPTFTADLAEAALRLIEAAPFGLYHLTQQGQCSWHAFAAKIFELAGVAADLQPCTTAERNDPARRPEYCVLTTEHGAVPRLRPWEEALADYLRQMG